MKRLVATIVLSALAGALHAEPPPSVWSVVGSPASPPFRLTIMSPAGEGTTGVFECEPEAVAITETGVTKIDDTRTGKIVGDEAGSTFPVGAAAAAAMALYTGRSDPRFVSATVRANPVRGWDLTIEIRKSDPAFIALSKAKAVSLMTTGTTGLVFLGSGDRKIIAAFVEQCRGS